MDIALIASCKRDELKDYQDALVEEMSRLTMQYGVLVHFMEIPDDEYKKYGDALSFYRSVHKEEVYLSAWPKQSRSLSLLRTTENSRDYR